MWTFLIVLVTVSGMTISHTPRAVDSEQECNDNRTEIQRQIAEITWRTVFIGPCLPMHRRIEVL